MSIQLTAKDLKDRASLVDFLARLGHQPVRKTGREKMYLSILRENDTKPSFSVNDELGVWFDHGTRQGGNIIDLGIALWQQLTFGEVIQKINDICHLALIDKRPPRPRIAIKIPNYIITEVKPIGHNMAINDYLKKRQVFDIGKDFLQEVYYYVQDEKGIQKNYFAAGWQNEKGAWEVRNKYFKGCLGSKAISFITGHPKKAAVFEGYLNYLSWKTEYPAADHSIIILNSVALLSEGIDKAKAFSTLDTYFDRDISGLKASQEFNLALPYATDRSAAFEGFNDYNDKIVGMTKEQVSITSTVIPTVTRFTR